MDVLKVECYKVVTPSNDEYLRKTHFLFLQYVYVSCYKSAGRSELMKNREVEQVPINIIKIQLTASSSFMRS